MRCLRSLHSPIILSNTSTRFFSGNIIEGSDTLFVLNSMTGFQCGWFMFLWNSLLSPSASMHNFILAKTWFIASGGICKNSGITWVSWDRGEVSRWTCVRLSLEFLLVNTGDWFVTMFGMSTSLYLSVNVTLADITLCPVSKVALFILPLQSHSPKSYQNWVQSAQ